MSDGSGAQGRALVTPELDARMLADLRAWRKTEHTIREIERGHQVWLDADELDMLLRAAAERDALKREACAMPDERPSERGLLPFCDCGSVDKYGDDLGEHSLGCPCHRAVLELALSPTISNRELNDLCKRTLAAMARE